MCSNIIFLDMALLLGVQLLFFHSADAMFLIQLFLINILVFAGLYSVRAFDLQTIKSLQAAFVATLAGTILGMVFALVPFLYFQLRLPLRHVLFIAWLYFLFLPLLNHAIGRRVINQMPPRNYLVIGSEEKLGSAMAEIKSHSLGKINPVIYINPEPADFTDLLGSNTGAIDGVLITDMGLKKQVEESLKKVRSRGLEVIYLPEVAENTLKRIPLDVIEKFKDYYEVSFGLAGYSPCKRLFDVVLSLALIIITAPVVLLFALALYVESGSPVIFRQERVGYNGRPFTLYKLRTMRESPVTGKNPNCHMEDRITRVGKIMRLLRVDELPQLINVLQGEMSLIGPRPEMIHFHQMCMDQVPYYEYRTLMKPGITGWAQQNYKHTTTVEDYKRKTEYDLYYIKNRHMFLDIQIALRTIVTVLSMRGAR